MGKVPGVRRGGFSSGWRLFHQQHSIICAVPLLSLLLHESYMKNRMKCHLTENIEGNHCSYSLTISSKFFLRWYRHSGRLMMLIKLQDRCCFAHSDCLNQALCRTSWIPSNCIFSSSIPSPFAFLDLIIPPVCLWVKVKFTLLTQHHQRSLKSFKMLREKMLVEVEFKRYKL